LAAGDHDATDFTLRRHSGVLLLTLISRDGMNRLTRGKVERLRSEIERLISSGVPALPLIISGIPNFSAGADLNEIAALRGPEALVFAHAGQKLMRLIEQYPATVVAAISGYCMGGGFDLALACHRRIAAPNAVFGHRGAALGLITGWGGTQRLPRLIGKARALEMLIVAEKVHAREGLHVGLVDELAEDPVASTFQRLVSAAVVTR
jgi:enoyl-CoA hydratase